MIDTSERQTIQSLSCHNIDKYRLFFFFFILTMWLFMFLIFVSCLSLACLPFTYLVLILMCRVGGSVYFITLTSAVQIVHTCLTGAVIAPAIKHMHMQQLHSLCFLVCPFVHQQIIFPFWTTIESIEHPVHNHAFGVDVFVCTMSFHRRRRHIIFAHHHHQLWSRSRKDPEGPR